MESKPLDWGFAYEEEIRMQREMLREARAEGSEKLARVPGVWQSYKIRDLDDDEIDSIAIFEAEVNTNRAIKKTRTQPC